MISKQQPVSISNGMAKKLLVITQKVDKKDPVLGFFHGWLTAFAARFEQLTVVCLGAGEFDLPENVKVLSLGKEEVKLGIRNYGLWNKLYYVWRFCKYIWRERNNYDVVFVHMNPEYVILGVPLWLVWRWRKKIILWYNHEVAGFWLRLAMLLANRVLYTSPYAVSARSKKSISMPVGIDTDVFKDVSRRVRTGTERILYLGRIAPIKGVDIIVEAVKILLQKKMQVSLTVVGDVDDQTAKDRAYRDKIMSYRTVGPLSGAFAVLPAEPSRKLVMQFYNANDFFINASPPGLFDKTVFEAMACGTIPLVSSKAFQGLLPPQCFFKQGDADDLAKILIKMISMSLNERQTLRRTLRQSVVDRHSLSMLTEKLQQIIRKL